MLRIAGLFSIVVSFLVLCSCKDNVATVPPGHWDATTSFAGEQRSGAYEFTIGNKAYVGLGFGGKNNNQYVLDSWAFNADSVSWKQVAPFPGIGRELCVSFSLGNKGYVGLGYNRYVTGIDSVELGDFWQFDPAGQTLSNGTLFAGSWKQLSNFPGTARYNAVAFANDSIAYVGSGFSYGSYYSDCWKYTPLTDTWTQTKDFPGAKREGAVALVLDGQVYFFGGDNGEGITGLDLWQFDLRLNHWTNYSQVSNNKNYGDFKAGTSRSKACAITLFDGYVIGGSSDSQNASTYQFDPLTQLWTKMTSFPGGAGSSIIGFSIDGRAYVTNCQRGTNMWQFQPD